MIKEQQIHIVIQELTKKYEGSKLEDTSIGHMKGNEISLDIPDSKWQKDGWELSPTQSTTVRNAPYFQHVH